MGMMSRRKGAAGEREAAEKLNEVLGTKFHRGRQYHGGVDSPDLAGDCPNLHLEVKRVESLALYPALEQARRDAGTHQVPAVMHRRNGKPWVLAVYADDLIRLLDVVDECRAKIDPAYNERALAEYEEIKRRLCPATPAAPAAVPVADEPAGACQDLWCKGCARSCTFANTAGLRACPRYAPAGIPGIYQVGEEG